MNYKFSLDGKLHPGYTSMLAAKWNYPNVKPNSDGIVKGEQIYQFKNDDAAMAYAKKICEDHTFSDLKVGLENISKDTGLCFCDRRTQVNIWYYD